MAKRNPNSRSCWQRIAGTLDQVAIAVLLSVVFGLCVLAATAFARPNWPRGAMVGSVTDSYGAAVAHASVFLQSRVRRYTINTTTDESGIFRFERVPEDAYEVSVIADGFATATEAISVRALIPIRLKISLVPAGAQNTVSATPVVENLDVPHIDIDLARIERDEVASSDLGQNDLLDIVALTSPSVARDSNGGFFHPLHDYTLTSQPTNDEPDSNPGTISGTVINQDGEPIGGAKVTVLRVNMEKGIVPMNSTNENGEFLFERLASGTYTISACDEEAGYLRTDDTFSAGSQVSYPRVEIVAGQVTANVVLQLGDRGGWLVGQVVD
ncbi:MAG: carboxypeptidase-like regulatory domain-containing protein, partial [Blastocatellia bacterium]